MGTRDSTPSLAVKLDKLFKSVQPLSREYTHEEVAKGCTELGDGTFSKTYVWQLRTGQRDNPTKRHLEALAAFFGVPVAYFFDDETSERVDSQLALVAALRNADIRNITLRAMELDDSGRKSMARIIEEITRMQRATERLPPASS
ncbi:helix-turn-helix domain-containing protein [Nocardia sp. CA-128927]|uniref:helix-turn-helix domain-containing protein n=1 Tax=Nocardia sp. CA-128927 TaxID=3239975 RepID=UPI003D972084